MTSQSVSDFYHHFPYPRVRSVLKNPIRFEHLSECVRLVTKRLPREPKNVLVAGCGTSEALSWALCLPEAQVLGIDLSENSLKIQSSLAKQMGVENLYLLKKDLLEIGTLGRRFDFISSFGVLHCLDDPQQGLKALAEVLQPGGMMRLMVYNQENRGSLRRLQAELKERWGENSSWDEKFRLARGYLSELEGNQGPWKRAARQLLRASEEDPESFADSLLNPSEHAFTLPQLMEWIKRAGLHFWFFENLIEWEIPSELAGSAESLTGKLDAINKLRSPFFIFEAGLEPSAQKSSERWFEDEDFLKQRVQVNSRRYFPVSKNFEVSREAIPPGNLFSSLPCSELDPTWLRNSFSQSPQIEDWISLAQKRFDFAPSNFYPILLSWLKQELFSRENLCFRAPVS